jgi:uncharacterized repeat protein (TIGR04138 family)
MAKAVARTASRKRYDEEAYRFVVEALHFTQQRLSRPKPKHADDESAHITGQELLIGLRDYASKAFGMLAGTVLRSWGVKTTDDVGRIVFELIDRGEMRKTDRDNLSDFAHLYDFREAFVEDYVIDVPGVFRQS